jgi:hypothetical protein
MYDDNEITQEEFAKAAQKSMWMGNSVWLTPGFNLLKEE